MAIQIVVDSSADYEKKELQEAKIACVPLTVTFGEEHFKDCFELTKEDFYERLNAKQEYPKTSQPSPEDFLQCFQKAQEAGDTVIAILLSSGLSGTYQSACLAKELCGYEKIYLIDSKTAVAGIRLLVKKAESMIAAGNSAEEIVEALENMKKRIQIRLEIDTLTWLYKGGRLTKAQTGIGELARLKPIIRLNAEGKLEVTKKCIGAKKAMAELADHLSECVLDEAFSPVFIYSHDKANCDRFIEFLKGKGLNPGEALCYNIGPTIGAHVGSGSFGYVYVEAE